MKKGRHRRFEEARKLKQTGPGAFLSEPQFQPHQGEDEADEPAEDDEYAEIAARYGAFDDDDEDDTVDDDDR